GQIVRKRMEAYPRNPGRVFEGTAIQSAGLSCQLYGRFPGLHGPRLRILEPVFEDGSADFAQRSRTLAVFGTKCLRPGKFERRGRMFSQGGSPDGRRRIAVELSNPACLRESGQNPCGLEPSGRK